MNQSSIKDTDLIILSLLDDVDLENVCEANQSMHDLCLYSDLWLTKIKALYDIPHLDIDSKEYKALYYKLKFNQWTDIVVWAEHNHMEELSEWIIYQENYKKFYILHADTFMNSITQVERIQKKKTLAIELFKFIYTHRLILNTTVKLKGFKKVLLNKLDDFASGEYKEVFELFKKHLQ